MVQKGAGPFCWCLEPAHPDPQLRPGHFTVRQSLSGCLRLAGVTLSGRIRTGSDRVGAGHRACTSRVLSAGGSCGYSGSHLLPLLTAGQTRWPLPAGPCPGLVSHAQIWAASGLGGVEWVVPSCPGPAGFKQQPRQEEAHCFSGQSPGLWAPGLYPGLAVWLWLRPCPTLVLLSCTARGDLSRPS